MTTMPQTPMTPMTSGAVSMTASLAGASEVPAVASSATGIAGAAAKLDRYIGYYEPYYNSHEALDKDKAVQEEARNVARSVVQAVKELRAGRLS